MPRERGLFTEGYRKMKLKAVSGMMLILLFIGMLTLAFNNQAASLLPTPIFEDNFESYVVGTFPYAGGWELWTDGAGNEYQVIVDNVSVSPSKSLQLRGYPNWLATASKRYNTSAVQIGFEVCVRAEESGGARVGFTKQVSSIFIRFYSAVGFLPNGSIVLRGYGELEPWVAGSWYKIKQVIDRSDDTCAVWINDTLRAYDVNLKTNDVPGEYHYNETEAFTLASSYEILDAYFDDIEMFEGMPPRHTLTIQSLPAGVTFTVDGVSRSTPWSGTYYEGASVSLVMPESHDGYVWSHWLEDGDPNRTKTVTMDTNITLTAIYKPSPPSPPVGGKATPIVISVNRLQLLAPYIGLTILLVVAVVTAVYVKKRKRNIEINF